VIASIPSPSSGVLKIGPLSIHAYGMMIALGVIAAVWLAGRRLEQARVGTRDDMGSIAIWGVGAGIVGARLYHVATDWSAFSDDLGRIPQIWKGGLGIPGGLLFGIIAGLWAAKRRGIAPSAMATAAAPAVPLAQAIGRVGNWWNQELYGRATDVPWALRIDDENLPAGVPSGTTFHPTFLYESLWNLALCGVLLYIDRRCKLRRGRLLAVYLLGYAIGRFWVEGLRIDPAHQSGGLRLNQWVALVVALGAAGFLFIDRFRTPLADDVATTDEAATDDVEVAEGDRAEAAETVESVEVDDEPADDEPADDSTSSPAANPPMSGSDAG
jgi:prolipoprotein diacylglyceryl transferase